MLPSQFTYLFGASLFIIPWIIFYLYRKDLRPMLYILGGLCVPLGVLAEYLWWTKDWWRPQTITGTVVGIEDAILSFFSLGVASSLYLVLFRRKWEVAKESKGKKVLFAGIIAFNFGLFCLLFASGINSFITTTVTFALGTAMFLITKRELIIPTLLSGVLMTVAVIPFYLAMIAVTPNYVEITWIAESLVGWYPLGIPIEDFVFYFVCGALSFSAYPFLVDAKLTTLR